MDSTITSAIDPQLKDHLRLQVVFFCHDFQFYNFEILKFNNAESKTLSEF